MMIEMEMMILRLMISHCITLSTSVGVVCCYVMMVKVVVVDNGNFSLHNAQHVCGGGLLSCYDGEGGGDDNGDFSLHNA